MVRRDAERGEAFRSGATNVAESPQSSESRQDIRWHHIHRPKVLATVAAKNERPPVGSGFVLHHAVEDAIDESGAVGVAVSFSQNDGFIDGDATGGVTEQDFVAA
ncbi:hypothetical protein K227x_45160 [Rubripirellula lacrimiformis]|uniref:Uncharacterized protein n=1 Tax=Rubripirellula lacrimiformis TaxID=1930273 RepID=A0A517NG46_9BACT|nr:hypothetical protein K227x_45160 [Rubripirellula lacrimiformis]